MDSIFDATGSLLIWDEPSFGKTNVLLELVSHILMRAENNAKEHIPVILKLSNWKKGQLLSNGFMAIGSSCYRSDNG